MELDHVHVVGPEALQAGLAGRDEVLGGLVRPQPRLGGDDRLLAPASQGTAKPQLAVPVLIALCRVEVVHPQLQGALGHCLVANSHAPQPEREHLEPRCSERAARGGERPHIALRERLPRAQAEPEPRYCTCAERGSRDGCSEKLPACDALRAVTASHVSSLQSWSRPVAEGTAPGLWRRPCATRWCCSGACLFCRAVPSPAARRC